MKKFNATKMMALLMALCLITSTFVGSTLAKYTTKETGTDSARVAKFGVTITANGETFAESYDEEDTAKTVVSSETGKKIVAPGTEGNMASMTLSGSPEVDVQVTYAATLDLDGWKINSEDYCPIEITVNGETFKKPTMAELKAAVEAKVASYTKTYTANTDLSGVAADSLKISWKWAFEGNDDTKDTALGNQAAAGSAATIGLTVTTTVTQIGD